MDQAPNLPRVVDIADVEWAEHPRFAGVFMRALLTRADNALANVSMVQVPPGREVRRHVHPTQVETVYLLAGKSILTVGQTEIPLEAGQLTAIPSGLEHALRNVGAEPVELLAFFTPPIR